jgi:hypothetical protein
LRVTGPGRPAHDRPPHAEPSRPAVPQPAAAVLATVPSSRAATAARDATPLGVRPPELIPLDPATEREVVALLARLLVDWHDQ